MISIRLSQLVLTLAKISFFEQKLLTHKLKSKTHFQPQSADSDHSVPCLPSTWMGLY